MIWIKYWPQALAAALLADLLWYAHHKGFQTAFNQQQAVIEQIKAEQQAAALAAEQAYAAKLAEVQKLLQAQQEKTQAVGVALAEAQSRARAQTAQNKKGIEDAIKQDKVAAGSNCIDGLGANSLRQYTRAIGY